MIVAVDIPSGNIGLVKTTMKENELTNMLRWQELTCQQKKSIQHKEKKQQRELL